MRAAQESAEKLATREAELAAANNRAQAAHDAVAAAQADLNAKTQVASAADTQQSQADAVRNRRQGAIAQASDTIASAKLRAAFDIVSIIMLWQSLNNACKAIDNSSGSAKVAAYFEFFSASVGIVSSAIL